MHFSHLAEDHLLHTPVCLDSNVSGLQGPDSPNAGLIDCVWLKKSGITENTRFVKLLVLMFFPYVQGPGMFLVGRWVCV